MDTKPTEPYFPRADFAPGDPNGIGSDAPPIAYSAESIPPGPYYDVPPDPWTRHDIVPIDPHTPQMGIIYPKPNRPLAEIKPGDPNTSDVPPDPWLLSVA